MKRGSLIIRPFLWIIAFGPAATHAGEFRIAPISANGSHTIIGQDIILDSADQRIMFEVFVSDWDTDLDGTPLLKAWEIDIDSAGYSSGTFGTLVQPLVECENEATPDQFCRALFGGACSISGVPCVDNTPCLLTAADICRGSTCLPTNSQGPSRCSAGVILTGRTDYVYHLESDLSGVDNYESAYRIASAIATGPGVEDPGEPRYVGTFHLDVPSDAVGTFEIDGRPDPFTVLVDENNEFIAPLVVTPARIVIACTTSTDCDDGDACTSDVCQPAGTCRNRANYNPASECCVPSDGLTCAIWPGTLGDVDDSGTIDLLDLAAMQTCMGEATISSDCAAFDFVCDCEISLSDHAAVVEVLSGP